MNGPAFEATIDRVRAAQLGLNVNAIASNVNTSLSSSEQVQPNFWTDPASGIPYYIAVQTPQYWADLINDLRNTPVSATLTSGGTPIPGLLSNVATLTRDSRRPTATRPTFSRSTTSMQGFRTATWARGQ